MPPLPIRRLMLRTIFTLAIALIFHGLYAQDDLDVISGKNQWLHHTDAPNALYHHLAREARTHLAERQRKVASLRTPEEWRQRQEYVRKTLLEIAGPFPERTPLNAKVLRTLRKSFYKVEHIVFESQPSFFVTASLFVPSALKKTAKAPAVIYCSGHSGQGYRSDVYQHVILNLVKKGFVVFAFDPVGQGERLEYYDAEKNGSSVGGPTSEHSYPGTQAFISGSSQAKHMIWDGIRAVDYLLTRREVDPARIGITGRSGGGTQSAYIAAFDERIHAVAPECYITSFTRLLESIGPQDAEQNFLGGIRSGIDHGDLLIARAPKPALMITTTRDMFSIQGARETANEVERMYAALGQGENFGMVEDDAPHASTKKNREALYAFLRKHLDNPGGTADEAVELLTADELRVTETGQVSTSLGGETVFSLNREAVRRSAMAADGRRRDMAAYLQNLSSRAAERSGYREPAGGPQPVFAGRIQRDGYSIEKYFLKGEGDYAVPFLLMVPGISNHKTILYLHPSGKAAAAKEAEALARNGFTVLAPDLPGTGELGPGSFKGDAFIGGISHNVWYTALLIDRSLAAVQAGDLVRIARSFGNAGGGQSVYGIARKEMASVLLHAATFFPAIEGVALVEPLISWHSLATTRLYYSPFISGAVPAQLEAYDLPDLVAGLAPRKCLIVNALNGAGAPATAEETGRDLSFPRTVYAQKDADRNFLVQEATVTQSATQALMDWLNGLP